VTTQHRRRLEDPDPQDRALDQGQLVEATNRINELLEGVARDLPPDSGLEISFIALPSADGEDRLQLSYIDISEEVATYFG
jgi:hypothetical protein